MLNFGLLGGKQNKPLLNINDIVLINDDSPGGLEVKTVPEEYGITIESFGTGEGVTQVAITTSDRTPYPGGTTFDYSFDYELLSGVEIFEPTNPAVYIFGIGVNLPTTDTFSLSGTVTSDFEYNYIYFKVAEPDVGKVLIKNINFKVVE